MNIAAILAFVATVASYIPALIQIGSDVAPLITGAREALAAIGTPDAPNAERFAELDALVKGYEDRLQALADPPQT